MLFIPGWPLVGSLPWSPLDAMQNRRKVSIFTAWMDDQLMRLNRLFLKLRPTSYSIEPSFQQSAFYDGPEAAR